MTPGARRGSDAGSVRDAILIRVTTRPFLTGSVSSVTIGEVTLVKQTIH